MNNFKWKVQDDKNHGIFNVFKKARHFTDEQFEQFIENRYAKLKPSQLPNIEKAKKRIYNAVNNKEHILIAGDYDCDGITSTAVMMLGLRLLTPYIDYDIPKREEGYGLNKNMVNNAIENGITLIITVDNGIECHEVIKYARDKGVDVIVTDHHELKTPNLPCEIAVDPMLLTGNYFKRICGCYVALKVLEYVIDDFKTNYRNIYRQCVCLAMIATIGDAMPLLNENRTFVAKVMQQMDKWDLGYGIDELMSQTGFDIMHRTSTDIAFKLVPVINALGRLSQSKLGVELFLCDDKVSAQKYAMQAVKLNKQRKAMVAEAEANIKIDDNRDVIVAVSDTLSAGLLGLMCNKISEKYRKPTYVLLKKGNTYGGSVRTYGDYNVLNCVTSKADLMGGGGHAFACGVYDIKADNLDKFINYVNEHYRAYKENNPSLMIADKTTGELIISKILEVACELDIEDINYDFMKQLEVLEPCGEANKALNFSLIDADILDYRLMGDNNQHIKWNLRNGLEAVLFNNANAVQYYLDLGAPNKLDFVYTLAYSWFRGKCTINLKVVDFKPSTLNDDF